MNKHEWAARQQEKPKLRPKEAESDEAFAAESEAAGGSALAKPKAPLAPDS